jgi:ribonuclease D
MVRRPPDVEPEIVSGDLTEEQLRAHLASPDLAVDTETMGLHPLRDRLCLVQLCDRSKRATLVQIPRFDGGEAPIAAARESRAPRLKRLLEAPEVEKVFHFARFDVAALRHHLGIDVAPLYCTRTASKLIRTYSARHGLKDNILELLDVEIDKAARHSDWSVEHLSKDQVAYALSDVTLLLELKDALQTRLERGGRAGLARECFQAIPVMAKLDLLGFEGLLEH